MKQAVICKFFQCLDLGNTFFPFYSPQVPPSVGVPLANTPTLGLEQCNKHCQAAKPSKSNPARRDVLREASSPLWHPRRPGRVSWGYQHSSAAVGKCRWRVAKRRDSSQPPCPKPLSLELAESPDRLAGRWDLLTTLGYNSELNSIASEIPPRQSRGGSGGFPSANYRAVLSRSSSP